jgi:hypothetical protein
MREPHRTRYEITPIRGPARKIIVLLSNYAKPTSPFG